MWQVNNLWVTSNNVATFQRFSSGRLGGYVKVNTGYSGKTLMDREKTGECSREEAPLCSPIQYLLHAHCM